MKKRISVMLALMLCLTISACGNKDEGNASSNLPEVEASMIQESSSKEDVDTESSSKADVYVKNSDSSTQPVSAHDYDEKTNQTVTFYHDTFSIQIPSTWKKDEITATKAYFKSDSHVFGIISGDAPETGSLDETITAYLKAMEKSYDDFTVQSTPAPKNFDGISGFEYSFTYDLNGTAINGYDSVVLPDNKFISILLYDIDGRGSHLEDYQKVVASIKHEASPSTESSVSAEGSDSAVNSGETWYSPSTYLVGTDLPAGTYYIKANNKTSAYWCLSSDSSGDSIIANDNVGTYGYLTATDGAYLQVKRGRIIDAANAPLPTPDASGNYSEGQYLIGRDIPAGEYKVSQIAGKTTSAYYAVTSDANSDDIVTNDNFDGDAYVTVSDGQYLTVHRATLKLAE